MAKSKYENYTKEQLIDKIKLLEKQRYGLVWEDKPEEIADQCERELPVLTEYKTKELVKDHSKPTNFIFEGYNYHTLYTLNFTHKRKIDTIYIDPPYNTGNKSWRYNNDYIDKEDRFRHSKWLSFMSKRLRLARRLLKDGYSGDMHPLIPVKCTHLLNYQFDKVILFFLNCLLLTRFYALCELPCL